MSLGYTIGDRLFFFTVPLSKFIFFTQNESKEIFFQYIPGPPPPEYQMDRALFEEKKGDVNNTVMIFVQYLSEIRYFESRKPIILIGF